jgi:hypothetical protein
MDKNQLEEDKGVKDGSGLNIFCGRQFWKAEDDARQGRTQDTTDHWAIRRS